LEQTTVAVEPAGGTTIVCRGGDELLKLRQPPSASGKSKMNVAIRIVGPPAAWMAAMP
jgi:hypothetical protein